MPMSFETDDADLWYYRNKDKFLDIDTDPIMKMISKLTIEPTCAIEFGCSDGYRLNWINKSFGSLCAGVEISDAAIRNGEKKYPDIFFLKSHIRHANLTHFRADLLIFGFCLYLVKPEHLTQVVWIADKVLEEGGHIIIWDYYSEKQFFRRYKHNEKVMENHMDYSSMFSWHPHYNIVASDFGAPEGPVFAIRKGGLT
jgi:trans-aconitate methyltransferase